MLYHLSYRKAELIKVVQTKRIESKNSTVTADM